MVKGGSYFCSEDKISVLAKGPAGQSGVVDHGTNAGRGRRNDVLFAGGGPSRGQGRHLLEG